MTLAEFRAWLEGYEASFTDGSPSPEQWKAVKAKLATVEGGSCPLRLTGPAGPWPTGPGIMPAIHPASAPTQSPPLPDFYPRVTCGPNQTVAPR